jgi:hypothetical protein
MVKVRAWLVPPLVQPRSPEFPLGVLTVTLAVPGAEIMAVVIVTWACWLLVTLVLSVTPLMTTTEAETKWLPFTVRRKPCCTSAKVIVLAERDPMTGAGRALPHNGLSAPQPWKINKASRTALRGRKQWLIRFTRHRTTRGMKYRITAVTSRSHHQGDERSAGAYQFVFFPIWLRIV